jgi:hypothetical protein
MKQIAKQLVQRSFIPCMQLCTIVLLETASPKKSTLQPSEKKNKKQNIRRRRERDRMREKNTAKQHI